MANGGTAKARQSLSRLETVPRISSIHTRSAPPEPYAERKGENLDNPQLWVNKRDSCILSGTRLMELRILTRTT